MFFFIPIGSEEGVRRLPYLTIGLIAVNLVIWIITNSILNNQVNELEKLQEQLFTIVSEYGYNLLEDPEMMERLFMGDFESLNEKVEAGGIIPLDSYDYERWQTTYNEYKEKRSNFVFDQLGFKPKEFNLLKILSSMFVHANFFHLLGNMIFLWMVGCNIEDDWSWKVFLGLYLISGVVACLIHAAVFPKSNIPLIGASGAIAGVMGAFMIRHYKTKIRFAYFFWFFFKPFIGTFAIYAGIVLPIWFLQQILLAGWSAGETGTAYYAHIGGFIFGATISTSFRFLGIEKKYIAPMVEDSFEKLKLSQKMKEAYQKLDIGDTSAAMPLLLGVISEEPYNFDARLLLARIYFEKGHQNDALLMYKKAFEIILKRQDHDSIKSLYEELKEKNMLDKLSEKNVYILASYFEKIENYEEAVKVFGLYVYLFPKGNVRPKAIYHIYQLFKDKLNNEIMAQGALAYLNKLYPDFPAP